MKLKARVVFEWVYKAKPEYYGTNDSRAAAVIDTETAADDIESFLDCCPNKPRIDIQPVK